jgi:hypothetical protein
MSQHSSSMKKRFRQIVDVKFKRRCRFYFEFCRFRIEDDHQCCVKYENFFIFSLIQIVFAKSFKDFRTRLFLTMLISSMRKFIFLVINTFKNAFSISKSSFDNFDEWKQRKLFFQKKNYFLCLEICFFEKKNHFFVLHRDISSRYFDCHKNVNRWFWFKFRRWCIVKRK